MKPFDLLEALKGGEVITRSGYRVILTNYIIARPYPLRGAIITDTETQSLTHMLSWNNQGRYCNVGLSICDLFMKEDTDNGTE